MSIKSLAASMTFAAATIGALSTPALAGEKPIGDPHEINGMEIAAVYLQPIKMEGMEDMGPTDVHVEADIHALKGNPNGFGEGEWIPYLKIKYAIAKVGSDWKDEGDFMPMVASDGPHYGKNIKLDGAGKYKISYTISPPSAGGLVRHIDKETGVGAWYKPFTVDWEFSYFGAGKKGGY